MSIRPVDNSYHVSSQISPKEIGEIAKAGYAAIVCMRPDGEGFFQPAFAEVEKAAKAAGLSAHYLPVGGGTVPMDQAKQLRAILRQAEGPVLAYCASGARCVMVYQLAQQAAG